MKLDFKPMEAEAVAELPERPEWLYEPKYDGFRALVSREDDRVLIRSKTLKPLDRYFPEIVQALQRHPSPRFVLDGEILIPDTPFETLQLRLHPAQSRIQTLAETHPASIIIFDYLGQGEGRGLLDSPFRERRQALEAFMTVEGCPKQMVLSKATESLEEAKRWLGRSGLDGIMAKRLDMKYQPGRRCMLKYKVWKTVDCVVGGVYWQTRGKRVDSLLLGLYDDEERLHYVGRARIYKAGETLSEALSPLISQASFTGRSPAETSRWQKGRKEMDFLKPLLVVEVSTDHITSDFMRHGARILRWRTDKAPHECQIDQIR